MNLHYEDNNDSILRNHLSINSNKYKKPDKVSSSVEIQSFGKNNFVLELKYNIHNKAPHDYDYDYDYIENELRRRQKRKTYSTYTAISNEESFFFIPKNKNKTNYKDYTNYVNYYPENIYNINNINYLIDKDINYKSIGHKEKYLNHPKEKKYILRKKNDKINELNYQRYNTDFISVKPLRNNNSRKKIFVHLRKDIKNIEDKKKRDFSKSKNQLKDYNIDKLKEIGDSLAMRFSNKVYQRKTMKYRENLGKINLINNRNSLSSEKKKYNSIINKMITIKNNRKESKNKLNVFNKTYTKMNSIKEKRHNNLSEHKKTDKIKTIDKDINLNPQIKSLKTIKVEENLINLPLCNNKKIKINNIIRRKKYYFKKDKTEDIK